MNLPLQLGICAVAVPFSLVAACGLLGVRPEIIEAFGTLSAFAGFIVVTLHQNGLENVARIAESRSRKAELELRLRAEFLKVAELRLNKDPKMTADQKRETLGQIQEVWMQTERIMHDEIKRTEGENPRG